MPNGFLPRLKACILALPEIPCQGYLKVAASRGAGDGESPAGARGVLATSPFLAAEGGKSQLLNSPEYLAKGVDIPHLVMV